MQVSHGVQETQDGGQCTAGTHLHSGPVAALAWDRVSDRVATGGADGAILLATYADVQAGDAGARHTTIRNASACMSVSGLCWTGSGALVSVGTEGHVMVWDVRKGGAAPVGGAGIFARGRRHMMGVEVAESNPHVVAVAEVAGVSLWDLRQLREPAWEANSSAAPGLSAGVSVRLDAGRLGTVPMPLLATSGDGGLFEVDAGASGGAGDVREVAREEAAMVAADVDPVATGMVFACTDCASLTVVDRRGGGQRGGGTLMW